MCAKTLNVPNRDHFVIAEKMENGQMLLIIRIFPEEPKLLEISSFKIEKA